MHKQFCDMVGVVSVTMPLYRGLCDCKVLLFIIDVACLSVCACVCVHEVGKPW